MKTFATLAAAVESFEALTTRFESTQGDLSAAESLAEEAGQAQATAEAALVTSKEAQTLAEENLQKETDRATALETDLATAKQESETLKAEAKTAEERAAQMCAEAGVDPVALDPANTGEGSLTEQYNAIKDPVTKSEFLQANKTAIYKEANQKK